LAVRQGLHHPCAEARLDAMLRPPLMTAETMVAKDEALREVDLNAQAILGYVTRWVNQGVGCSKVPDLEGVALMEDRATLRIASQALANWVLHGVVSAHEVKESLLRMAAVVDEQNSGAAGYAPHGADPERTSVAFHAALDLVLKGVEQPGGYTEETLTKRRRQVKLEGPRLVTK
jgi:malate synthase